MTEYLNRNVRFEISPSQNKIFIEIFGNVDISDIARACFIQLVKDKSNSDQLYRMNTKTDRADSKWF